MTLWAAFILGLVGSLHCAGMCGPLALALPRVKEGRASFVYGRVLYNLGRITTYAVIGMVFGLAGSSIALGGFQRWLSIGVGVVLLLSVAGVTLAPVNASGWRIFQFVRQAFGALVRRQRYAALFALGVVNGFLPCGLVYVAAAGAAVGGSILGAVGAMASFGLGMMPMMLGMPLLWRQFRFLGRIQARHFVPATVAVVGVLLVLRGMELGIPYLSPVLGATEGAACH